MAGKFPATHSGESLSGANKVEVFVLPANGGGGQRGNTGGSPSTRSSYNPPPDFLLDWQVLL